MPFWSHWLRRLKRMHGEQVKTEKTFPITYPVPTLQDIPYVFPKDLSEEDRLDFQHHVFYNMLGSHYVAPVRSPRHILDVGTGTGIWARTMCAIFPKAQVIGLDIADSEKAPTKPENYTFQHGDILKGLPFPDNYFDFVHQRMLVGAIPVLQWRQVIVELTRVAQRGGWIELLETHDYVNAGPASKKFMNWGKEVFAKRGLDYTYIPHLDKDLAYAGLTNITKRQLLVPVGQWGGGTGSLLARDMLTIFPRLGTLYVSILPHLTKQEFDETVAALPQEWETLHTQAEFFIFYGKKP